MDRIIIYTNYSLKFLRLLLSDFGTSACTYRILFFTRAVTKDLKLHNLKTQ